jgi:hypothetical protein
MHLMSTAENRLGLGLRGGSAMTAGSGGSAPNASAGSTLVPRSIASTCTPLMGQWKAGARRRQDRYQLADVAGEHADQEFTDVLVTDRPSSTAAAMEANESSSRTMTDASSATSAPVPHRHPDVGAFERSVNWRPGTGAVSKLVRVRELVAAVLSQSAHGVSAGQAMPELTHHGHGRKATGPDPHPVRVARPGPAGTLSTSNGARRPAAGSSRG